MGKRISKTIALILSLLLIVGIFASCKPDTPIDLSTLYLLNVTSKEMKVGEVDSLMVLDGSDGDRTFRTTWSSSDPSVVEVKDIGMLEALKPGTAVITATVNFTGSDESLDLKCNITVVDSTVHLTSIEFDQAESTHSVNDTILLNLIFTPANATNKKVTYTSSDDNIVTVIQASGIAVTRAEGTAIITATSEDGSLQATRQITVVNPTDKIENLTLSRTTLSLVEGKTSTLTATVTPSTETPTIIWRSDNESVATVENGLVRAIKEGTANITATINDVVTQKVATCKVRVYEPEPDEIKATGVSLNKDKLVVVKSSTDTIKFVATVTPSNTTEKGKWSSSDTTVATVNSSTGVITINPELTLSEGESKEVTITYTIGSVKGSGVLVVMGDVTEPPTDAPTEPVTEPPTDAPTEPVTEPSTDAPTEPVSEGPTEPDTSFDTSITVEADSASITSGSDILKGTVLTVTINTPDSFSPDIISTLEFGLTADNTGIVYITEGSNKYTFTVTALSEGSVKLTATVTDTLGLMTFKQSTFDIKVVEPEVTISHPASKLILSTTSTKMQSDEEKAITAFLTPASGETTDDIVIWTSTNPGVAKLEKSETASEVNASVNKIIAVGPGKCTITAKLKSNGSILATCTVSVTGTAEVVGNNIYMYPSSTYLLTSSIKGMTDVQFELPNMKGVTFTYANSSVLIIVAEDASVSNGSIIIKGTKGGDEVQDVYNLFIRELPTENYVKNFNVVQI